MTGQLFYKNKDIKILTAKTHVEIGLTDLLVWLSELLRFLRLT